jgi:hypothetical protein
MPRGMREDERVMVMVEYRVYFLRLTFLAYWLLALKKLASRGGNTRVQKKPHWR